LPGVMLPIDQRIDRAQKLLRLLEEDAPLLAVRVAPLSPERQRSVRTYVQRLAECTRAEIQQLLHEKTVYASIEQNPSAAD
jgi:hypothetical protein